MRITRCAPDNPEAPRAGEGARRRGPRRAAPGSAARTAGAGEGQHRHRRPADDGRVAGPGRAAEPGPGRDAGAAAARGRDGRASARPTSASGPTSATGSRRPGWSAYGGLTRNPYALNRSAGGSSSGSGAAVAAGITPLAVGTETDGSITCPAAFNGCVGIKPTVGLVPTTGVVPVSRSQDSPGPDGGDGPRCSRTARRAGRQRHRLRVVRRRGSARREADRRAPQGVLGLQPPRRPAAERAVQLLAAEGATIVDHTDLDSMADFDLRTSCW